MSIKRERCKQTDSRRRNWTQQDEDDVLMRSSIILFHSAFWQSGRIFCFSSPASTNTSTQSAIVVVVVVMTGYVKMSRGGAMASSIRKVCRFAVRMRFSMFPPWDQVSQKCVFTGSVWTIGQNDATRVSLHTEAFPCGRSFKSQD